MLASSELVDEIYRAALSPSEWEPFLAQMARTFHAAVAMLLHVWSGHADGASPYRPLILIEQWAHFVAIGAWVGGLVWLLLGLRGQEAADRAAAVRRFSRIATLGTTMTNFLKPYFRLSSKIVLR